MIHSNIKLFVIKRLYSTFTVVGESKVLKICKKKKLKAIIQMKKK